MYHVKFAKPFNKLTKGIDKATMKRISDALDKLASDPYPYGFKPIKGKLGYSRIRVGDYRIIYQVHKSELIVLVVRIDHRRDIYQRL